jgi:hypothetical protein
MEPFSTIDKDSDKVSFLEGLCDASKMNFANPKSPTCATISSLRIDVAWLYITVDNRRFAMVMKIFQCISNIHGYA